MIGPIVLYAHEDTDEDYEDYFSDKEKAQWTPEEAQAAEDFLLTNPLYEVAFEFYLDSETHEYVCTKVDLDDGHPFTRPCPGEQLTLFDQDA